MGDLAENFDQAQRFRDETLNFVRRTLGLDETGQAPETTNDVIQSFDVIGQSLRNQASRSELVGESKYRTTNISLAQCNLFLKEVEIFLNKSGVEQQFRLTGNMVNLSDYWQFRLGSSAVGVVVAVNE